MKKIITVFLSLFFTGIAFSQNTNIEAKGILRYSGETCANIWGYASGGNEYALVGASKGLSIVDVTNPDSLSEIVQIPGPDNLWKEVRTLGQYAYVTSEGGNGLQIIDLSGLPDPNVNSKYYTGDGAIVGQLNTIHALHIDTITNHIYLYGSNIGQGGAIVLDLVDPWNPTFVTTFDDLGYIHDGYVDNDTLYGAHINGGFMSIVDFTDKSNPANLGLVFTPNSFTHNTWILEDRKTVLTTDEVNDSYLAAYDVSDPTDIKLLDKVQSNPGSNVMVHNTYVKNNYAITSWYADGITIVDVTDPSNLVQVGNYDIAPTITGGGSNGTWGVYPYLPSGNLLGTNINVGGSGELWVLAPTYERACYLDGIVTEMGSGLTLPGVQVEIIGGDIGSSSLTDVNGFFSAGQLTAGDFQLQITKPGYDTAYIDVSLQKELTTSVSAVLQKGDIYNVQATTVRAADGSILANAFVKMKGLAGTYEGQTDPNGFIQFNDVFSGTYEVIGGAWGYGYDVQTINVADGNPISLELPVEYKDDFVFDYGWTVDGTSLTGVWERGEPIEVNPGFQLVPGSDMPGDVGEQCYITGNGMVGIGEDAVNDGTMNLTSPSMDLTSYNEPIARFSVWFSHITINQTTLDTFKVYASNGMEEVLLFNYTGFTPSWKNPSVRLADRLTITDNMRIIFRGYNNPAFTGFDSYEALVDRFFIREGNPNPSLEPELSSTVTVAPNPFHQSTSISWSSEINNPTARIYDIAGKMKQEIQLSGKNGIEDLGSELPNGMWFVRLEVNGKVGETIKIIKL